MLSLGVEPRISTLLVWRLTNLAIKANFDAKFSTGTRDLGYDSFLVTFGRLPFTNSGNLNGKV